MYTQSKKKIIIRNWHVKVIIGKLSHRMLFNSINALKREMKFDWHDQNANQNWRKWRRWWRRWERRQWVSDIQRSETNWPIPCRLIDLQFNGIHSFSVFSWILHKLPPHWNTAIHIDIPSNDIYTGNSLFIFTRITRLWNET